MLTHRTYPTNAGGTFTMVSGTVRWDGLTWRISTGIERWSDGFYHVGHEVDSQKARVKHFNASKIGGSKYTAEATIPEKRALITLVERALAAGQVQVAPSITDCWTRSGLIPNVDQITIESHAPVALSTTQSARTTNTEIIVMANQCAIYLKYGLGERCQKSAVDGDPRGRCKLHVHLESLCGPLPTEKGDFRPTHLKKAKQVVEATALVVAAVQEVLAPVAPVVPEGMVARMTPDALAEAVATEPAPSTPTQKPKQAKKTSKKASSPKA